MFNNKLFENKILQISIFCSDVFECFNRNVQAEHSTLGACYRAETAGTACTLKQVRDLPWGGFESGERTAERSWQAQEAEEQKAGLLPAAGSDKAFSFLAGVPWRRAREQSRQPLISIVRCDGLRDQCNMEVFVSSLLLFAQRIDSDSTVLAQNKLTRKAVGSLSMPSFKHNS